MKRNVGINDKTTRLFLALLIIAFGLGKLWSVFAVYPLITGILNFCPMYYIFGKSTITVENKNA